MGNSGFEVHSLYTEMLKSLLTIRRMPVKTTQLAKFLEFVSRRNFKFTYLGRGGKRAKSKAREKADQHRSV